MNAHSMSGFWSFRPLLEGDVNHANINSAPSGQLHRLIIRARPGSDDETTTEFAEDLAIALQAARRTGRPVEVWRENDHLCTIDTMGGAGSMWIITPGPTHSKRRKQAPEVDAVTSAAELHYEAVFCIIDGLEERDVGDCVVLSAKTAEGAEKLVARLRPPPGVNCVKVRHEGKIVLRRIYPSLNIDEEPAEAAPVPCCSASEAMFYLGMPLSHVVVFEEHRREKRRHRQMERFRGAARAMPAI